MKRIIFAVLTVCIVLSAGCKRIIITTVVHKDQSVQRTISMTGDSADIQKTAYPFPTQNGWSLTRKTSDEKTSTFTVSKTFSSVIDLNEEFYEERDSIAVRTRAYLVKFFRWFYTTLRYEERFYAFNPFQSLSLNDYFSEDELQAYYADTDTTAALDDKMETFNARVIFHDYFAVFKDAVLSSSQFDLTAEQLEAQRDSLFHRMREFEFTDTDLAGFFLSQAETIYNPETSFQTLHPEFQQVNQKFAEYSRLVEQLMLEDYSASVILPHPIIDSNANRGVQDSIATWEFASEHFHHRDYLLWAESRQWNTLSIVVTAVALLLVVIVLGFALWRARRHHGSLTARKPCVMRPWISILCIVVGLLCTGLFGMLFLTFNAEPELILFDVFNPTPEENAFYILGMTLGVALCIIGTSCLVMYSTQKRKLNRMESR